MSDSACGNCGLQPSTHPNEGCRRFVAEPTDNGPCTNPDCRLYLGRVTGPMAVELVDGCHSSTSEVAKAAKLHASLFGDHGPWVMVELTEPWWDTVASSSTQEEC